MQMRTKLEVIGGVVLAVLLGLYVHERIQGAIALGTAQQVSQITREQVAAFEKEREVLANEKQTMKDADAQRQKEYDAKSANLAKMTTQQITDKASKYVPGAKEPLKVLGANSAAVKSGEAKEGDVIVPKSDVRPFAQNTLDGDKCKADFGSCKSQLVITEQSMAKLSDEFKLKTQESERWEKAAKGGSAWKRVGKKILYISVGVGIGYAIKGRF